MTRPWGSRSNRVTLLVPRWSTFGAGRVSKADKARAFTIARGEALEAFAALEVAAITGKANAEDVARCHPLTNRLYGLLTGLIR